MWLTDGLAASLTVWVRGADYVNKEILTRLLGGRLAGTLPLLLLHLPPGSDSGLEVLAGRARPRPAGVAPRALCLFG